MGKGARKPAANSWRDPRNWLAILLGFALIGGALALAEEGARLYVCQPEVKGTPVARLCLKALMRPYLQLNLTPNSGFRWRQHEIEINSRGFRGPEISVPKPAGVFRIALLGGSTVYETGVRSWREDSARALQSELRDRYGFKQVEVVNAGVPSHTSWDTLIHFELDVVDLQPDLVILYDNLNDVVARLVPPSNYAGDNRGMIFRKEFEQPFPFNLTLVRLLSGSQYKIIQPQNEFGNQYTEAIGGRPLDVLAANPPVYFERNERSILGICRENGIQPVIATFAYTDKYPDDWVMTPQFRKGIAEHNVLLAKLAKSRHVPLYDHAAEFPVDKQYWFEGRHVNAEGAKLKGQLFARYLVRNGLILSPRAERVLSGK